MLVSVLEHAALTSTRLGRRGGKYGSSKFSDGCSGDDNNTNPGPSTHDGGSSNNDATTGMGDDGGNSMNDSGNNMLPDTGSCMSDASTCNFSTGEFNAIFQSGSVSKDGGPCPGPRNPGRGI